VNKDGVGQTYCAVAIMSKAPRAGMVKTRLTTVLSPEEAASLNICFLQDIAAAIARLGPRARGVACFTPAEAEQYYRDLLPEAFGLLPQRGKDLSERLINITEDLFCRGFPAVCLIGSDSPTLPICVFDEAIAFLNRPGDCVVLGPSEDGGYYFLGLKQPHRDLFEGIDWSTDKVAAQTLERADRLRLPVYLLPLHYDVDDPESLRRLCRELLGRDKSTSENPAPATALFLRQLIAGKPFPFSLD
jgi:rSAM/selenodomain-associated transferase 1